jgi:predicted enzyme involved in methoxymalonyl-ACP biosynthesis
MVSPPKVGDVIRMRSWHGIVLDVFTNEAGKSILRVQTVRNIFRRLNPEFVEYNLAPDAITPATVSDLQAEIEQYHKSLNESLEELMAVVKANGEAILNKMEISKST